MILYYVSSLNLGIASTRYRAMLPALYLQRAGIQAEVRTGELDAETLQRAGCLIIVKAFNHHTMKMCDQAARLGTPVILDLCDDIFDESYGNLGGDMIRQHFAGMATLAASIVTTTPTLADKIRRHVPVRTTVHIVPDMVERTHDVDALERLYRPVEIKIALPLKTKTKTKKKARPKLLKYIRRAMRRASRHVVGDVVGPKKKAQVLVPQESVAAEAPFETAYHKTGKVILWFGNHGAAYSDTGMAQLLWLAGDLARLSKDHQLRLVVVSNHHAKFNQIIRPLPFPTEYVEWTPKIIHSYLKCADVCVVPFGRDAFSLAKSPNRVLLSLSSGVPVVASDLPSLGPLKDCILIENWYDSIKTYFERPDLVHSHLAAAQKVITEHFDGTKVSEQWRQVVNFARKRVNSRSKSRILFFFQLIQDFDLLMPLVHAAKGQFDITIGILAQVALTAPESLSSLGKQGMRTFFLHEIEIATLDPRDPRIACDLLVTASESSAAPHQFAKRLAEIAKANDTVTVTLQHGLENVGLTYKDERYDDTISFSSDFVLTWGPVERLPEWVSGQTISKVVPVGCPKPIVDKGCFGGFPLADRDFVAVFENLHWSRYSDGFRSRFLADLCAVARAFPDKIFVLKPHPAGQWFTARRQGEVALPENIVIADPKSPLWSRYGADAFIAFALGIITTPSTIAFDAARCNRPTAIVAYDVDTSLYDPLPKIASETDWASFVRALVAGTINADHILAFRERTALPGDAIPRVLAVFLAALARGTHADLIDAAVRAGGAIAIDNERHLDSLPEGGWRLKSLVDGLSDEQLGELNSILDWNAWVTDHSGRGFGVAYSASKRAQPDPLPDPRIVELNCVASLAGKTVLEVGCFEGIHTSALCNFAEHVKACDVRVSLLAKTAVRCAFLGCRPELFLWNVEEEVPHDRDISCDVLHHVGVLYHLKDPVTHLHRLLPAVGEAILLDTHVASDELASDILDVGDRQYRVRRYREGGLVDPFSGAYDHANWLLREDLVALLAAHGFAELVVDRLRSERNGSRLTIIARRRR